MPIAVALVLQGRSLLTGMDLLVQISNKTTQSYGF